MRISGLNSGIDTEQMIKDIMTAQRIPVDRVFQQKVKAEWKRDAYRDVNTKLYRFDSFLLGLRLPSTFQRNIATSSRTDILNVTAAGDASPGTYDLKVTQLATSAQFVSDSVELDDNTPESFVINGKTISVGSYESAEDFVATVAKEINKDKDLGISAYAHGSQISFTTKEIGAGAEIIVDKNFTEIFGGEVDVDEVPIEGEEGDQPAVGTLRRGDQEMIGQDAIVEINGLITHQSSNTFDLNGITVNLLEANKENPVTVRIEVRHDVDAVVDKIKEFVDLYNELVDEFNLMTREETFRDFPPLTDAQRADMSDKDIELWEEKAKSGLLRSDSILSGILSEMRIALGAVVKDEDGNAMTMAQIGITTGSWYEYGRLNVNEDKLRAAVEENPDGVQNLFMQGGDKSTAEPGIARRLDAALDKGMERLTETAGKASISYDESYLGKQIRDYESRLSAMEERLLRYEENQWRKFTAMERVLGELYAQGDWLTQQLMSMQG